MNKIVETARKYIGQQEKAGNMGFKDEHFEDSMESVGFRKGDAWCNYFVELVYLESMPELKKKIERLMSASTQKTWKNFMEKGNPEFEMSTTPDFGDLVVWQSRKNENLGHIGIVSDIIISSVGNLPEVTGFKSIEGNTNDKGGREGYIVAEQKHTLKDSKSMKLLGFIHYVG